MRTNAAFGSFVSWTGGALLIGECAAVVPEHAHYAIQIAFGLRPGIRFRTGERWAEYGGAIIPSRTPHSMDATRVTTSAVLLVEPETAQGRALARRYLQHGIAAVPEDVLAHALPKLFGAYNSGGQETALRDACQDVIRALTANVDDALVVDERILRAIAYINRNLDLPLTLDRVASEACLSPSRFRHVFVETTGMALRPYILWRRFLHVWELLAAGASLSSAAHSAGFADAAHLTRTSRSMFGFPPSALQVVRQRPVRRAPVAPAIPRGSFMVRPAMQPLRTSPTRASHVS